MSHLAPVFAEFDRIFAAAAKPQTKDADGLEFLDDELEEAVSKCPTPNPPCELTGDGS